MKDHINAYMDRLKKTICEYMTAPVNERSAMCVSTLMNTLHECEKYEHKASHLTEEEAKEWCKNMQNADGTTGGHWTIEESTPVAESLGVNLADFPPYMWNIVLNMMYSDYYNVATKYGVGTAEFYGDLAKAFIYDKDAKEHKLSNYYNCIVR